MDVEKLKEQLAKPARKFSTGGFYQTVSVSVMRYTPRKPSSPPSAARILIRDNWALAAIVIPGILVFSSLYLLFSTPGQYRDQSFWLAFNLFFFVPVIIAVPFLLWRVPRHARQVRELWKKGDFVIGEVKRVDRPINYRRPTVAYYQFTYNNKTYDKSFAVGRFWKPCETMELPLIVNPEKPEEVIIVDQLY